MAAGQSTGDAPTDGVVGVLPAEDELTGLARLFDLVLGPARKAFERTQRWSTLIATVTSLLAGVVVLVTGRVLLHGFRDEYFTVQFATNDDRLAGRIRHFAEDPDTALAFETAQQAQLRGVVFAVIWGLIGASLFYVLWRRCWHVGPAIKPVVLKFIAAVPLAGATLAVVEKLLTLAALTGGGPDIGLRSGFGPVIVTLAWAKWVLAGTTILLVIAMIVSAATGALQRGLRADDPFTPTVAPAREGGTGVSCSGGGIRAASFSLGAMSALERWPAAPGATAPVTKLPDSLLGSANYLSSVSGGGYAASAWRIAAGVDRARFAEMPPIIGDPFELSTKPGERGAPSNLLEHVRYHRSFLANGRGGLPLAAIRYAIQTAFHMTLLLGFVYMLSWPFGILLRSWSVDAFNIVDAAMADGATDRRIDSFRFGSHQWIPPLAWLGAAAVPWLIRLGTTRGRLRDALDGLIAAFAILAIGSAFVLIVLPWMTANINIFPDDADDQLRVTGIYAAALTGIWQLAKRYLKRQAKYLGGVLLAVGLGLFALRAVEEAVVNTSWLGRLLTYCLATTGVFLAFLLANPDKWSLSDFYRKRLAGTFVTKLDDNFHPSVLSEDDAPALSQYIGVPGPAPIVCCAASRTEEAETGVAALSMTFEPDKVTVHRWRADDTATGTQPEPKSLSQIDFKKRLPHGKQGDRLASLIGAAAISGAAVAPSMGRLNLKTTNALLAAFNARLGVWVPNPASEGLDRMAAPRVVNMFKEIFGVYGNTDPNVYATDGGHWENLGLVELVRKECDFIVAIDTSGNLPGTYSSLKDAIALAFLECRAKIEISQASWDAMIPGEDGLVPQNFLTGTIHYLDGSKGELLYVKAAVSRTTPIAVQRYAAGDRSFPNYSTANQMLTDAQLTNLFKLGYASMETALGVRAKQYAAEHPLASAYSADHAGG